MTDGTSEAASARRLRDRKPSRKRPVTDGRTTDRPAGAVPATRPRRRLHLLPRHRAQIEALLREHLPDVEVWAYGSRVSGDSHDGSDLDLILRAPGLEKVPMDPLCDLWEVLRDSTIPFLVEARDWARLPESFHGEIERDYVVLVKRASEDARTKQTPSTPPWHQRNWGELATLEYGKALRNYRNADGQYFVFGTNGPIGRHTDAISTGPTVIVGRKGAYRGINYSSEPCWVIDTAFYLKAKKDIDIRWAYYALRNLDINNIDSGSAIPSTSREDFYALPVVEPPLSEQRAIAHVLGALDDRIELNHRMNATLEAMVRTLFKSWFVDFDPVQAKIAGRKTGLPKDIADLFPDRLVESEPGPIPEGWSLGQLGDIASLNPESWNTRDAPDKVAYVDLANTKWGHIETVEVHPWSTAPSRARRVLRPGDTIVGTVRPGNGSYALIGGKGLTGSTGFAVLRPRRSCDREIVWCAATSRGNIDRLAHLADGGAYPAVRPHTVADTRIVLSDTSVRQAFSSLTAGWFDRMENNKRASRRLAALRDALLTPLVSGESRVRTSAA